jgi:hypothetical protein
MNVPNGYAPGLNRRRHGRVWGMSLGSLNFLVYYIMFTASWSLAVNFKLSLCLGPLDLQFPVFFGVALFSITVWCGSCRCCRAD